MLAISPNLTRLFEVLLARLGWQTQQTSVSHVGYAVRTVCGRKGRRSVLRG